MGGKVGATVPTTAGVVATVGRGTPGADFDEEIEDTALGGGAGDGVNAELMTAFSAVAAGVEVVRVFNPLTTTEGCVGFESADGAATNGSSSSKSISRGNTAADGMFVAIRGELDCCLNVSIEVVGG
jgi:hypothetical protein